MESTDEQERRWFEALKSRQAPRDFLIQHDEVGDQCPMDEKGNCALAGEPGHIHRWHVWPCDEHPGLPFFHFSILDLMILWECDKPSAKTADGWRTQREENIKLIDYLRSVGIEPEVAYGGSKSFHIAIYLDTESFDVPEEYLDDGIDVLRTIRLTLWDLLPKRAGVKITFDRNPVNFYSEREGRMVRNYGTRRRGSPPKTAMPSIPETRPEYNDYSFPARLAAPFSLRPFEREILDALEREKSNLKVNAKMAVDEETREIVGKDWKRLVDFPWIKDGVLWPEGERYNYGGLCIIAMLNLGFDDDEIRAELRKLEAHVEDKSYEFNTHWHEKIAYRRKRAQKWKVSESEASKIRFEKRMQRAQKAAVKTDAVPSRHPSFSANADAPETASANVNADAPVVEKQPAPEPGEEHLVIVAARKIPADLIWGKKSDRDALKALLALPTQKPEEIWDLYKRLRKNAHDLNGYIDFTALEKSEKESESLADAEANSLASRYDVQFGPGDVERLQDKDLEWAVGVLSSNIILPARSNYIEVLVVAIQSFIKDLLPPEGLLYLKLDGDYSAAKTFLKNLVLRLGAGININGATEALVRHLMMKYPQRLLGMDEVDDELKERPYLEVIIKEGNTWDAWRPFLAPGEAGRGWEIVEANVGGPKVLTNATRATEATSSRCIPIQMEKHLVVLLVVKKLWGSEEVTDVAKWLKIKAAEATKKWSREEVKSLSFSKNFLKEVDDLTKDFDIPRGAEIVILEALVGKILGWDVAGVLKNAQNNQNAATEDTEFLAEKVATIYARRKKVAGPPMDDPDQLWRKNEKGEVEVLSTALLDDLNESLSSSGMKITPARWKHVKRSLGWTMNRNWYKEDSRAAAKVCWRGKSVLIFDKKVLDRLEVSP